MSAPKETLTRVRVCIERVIADRGLKPASLSDEDALFGGGWVDSLSIVSLLVDLEKAFGMRFPSNFFADSKMKDSISGIALGVEALKGKDIKLEPVEEVQMSQDAPKLRFDDGKKTVRGAWNFWTLVYRVMFTFLGVRFGKGLKVWGPIILRLDGKPNNLIIGNNVTLMPWVDLKNRENGKIILSDGVTLDTCARLVAANNAAITLGDGVSIGIGSVLNAGADITLGRGTGVAGYCSLLASEHSTFKDEPIFKQEYRHDPIIIGEDVWLAANVLVARGSTIGSGAVISAKAYVSGNIPPNAIAAGVPARVIKERQVRPSKELNVG